MSTVFSETVKVLLGELESGFGEEDVDELLGYVENELTLGVSNLGTDHGGGVLRGGKTVLALFAAFEKIAETSVELSSVAR